MATLHLSSIYCPHAFDSQRSLGRARGASARPAHLLGMNTDIPHIPTQSAGPATIERVLSLSELCVHLHVSAQTLSDLRCQGRGPRGFRVGRELRFRVGEIEAWLDLLEQEDQQEPHRTRETDGRSGTGRR